MIRIEDWQVRHNGGAVRVVGWLQHVGGDRVRVSSGRLVATRIGQHGREGLSRGGVGPIESCMHDGVIARDGLGHEFFLAAVQSAA